ncbi:hypothetical protein [Streptomyces sp. NBC_01197]|uniref:hypothetical protein n=1 Tax=Streptomyces sp. NBC_01197 TaxID=2903768 RepID=UPI002E115F75|nr:hypothetical protein OG452_30985 [Streptomyces sp. NBC_01197]
MHRTKIITLALLGAAVWAATGCVAVPPAPPPPPGPSRTPGHHAQDTGPQIVQGPPVEALETVPPGTGPGHRTAVPPPGRPPARRPGGEAGPGLSAGTGPAPVRHTVRPSHPRTAHPRRVQPAQSAPPRLPKHAAHPSGTNADVCALGEGYGGWPQDSPQARICHQTYGR